MRTIVRIIRQHWPLFWPAFVTGMLLAMLPGSSSRECPVVPTVAD